MNAVVLQNHLRVNLEFKKKTKKPPTLDPMNAKIDLATLNGIKKYFHIEKNKYFGLLTLLFVAIAIEISW